MRVILHSVSLVDLKLIKNGKSRNKVKERWLKEKRKDVLRSIR